jgi:hypothetical protein
MIQGLVVNLSSLTKKIVVGETIPDIFIVVGGGDKFSSGRVEVGEIMPIDYGSIYGDKKQGAEGYLVTSKGARNICFIPKEKVAAILLK